MSIISQLEDKNFSLKQQNAELREALEEMIGQVNEQSVQSYVDTRHAREVLAKVKGD